MPKNPTLLKFKQVRELTEMSLPTFLTIQYTLYEDLKVMIVHDEIKLFYKKIHN